jgi:hypothetical protein
VVSRGEFSDTVKTGISNSCFCPKHFAVHQKGIVDSQQDIGANIRITLCAAKGAAGLPLAKLWVDQSR